MKVYKFIFIVGFLNLSIPFFGIPFVYKNYAVITLAIITLGYALIVRAVEKERQNHMVQTKTTPAVENSESKIPVHRKKIEDVVEMVEQKDRIIITDITPKRRARKPKVVHEDVYE